jgi:hypothetical protein
VGPPVRTQALFVGAPLAILSVASIVGTLLSPTLLRHNPLLLVVLSPRSTFLVAAADRTPLPVFMGVGLVRLSAAGPPHFSIGQVWGRSLSTRLQQGPWPARQGARATEWLFNRLGAVALVVLPTGRTVALASASDMRRARVACSHALGVAIRLALLYTLGHHLCLC